MTYEADLAPIVDRLVLSVNTAARAETDAAVDAMARQAGLESAELLGHYAEFLLAGRLTDDLAVGRLHYQSSAHVLGRATAWEAAGLITRKGDRAGATAALAPVLEAILDARRVVATRLWSGHDQVGTAFELLGLILQSLPAEFVLAVEHAALPDPEDPFQALHQRLTTMRYVRSHCHARAWRARGLHRHDIMAMTALWHGQAVVAVPGGLTEKDLADRSGLTEQGLAMRLEIEADTNTCNAPALEVLDDQARHRLLTALSALPGQPV